MKKENDVSDKKEEVLCRLRRVARASTEEKYHSAVNDLLTSEFGNTVQNYASGLEISG